MSELPVNIRIDLGVHDNENPLLRGLPQERTHSEWYQSLGEDPLKHFKLPSILMESHAELVKDLYVPSTAAADVAMRMQSMLRKSLRTRDPRVGENRRHLFEMARLTKKTNLTDDLEELPKLTEGAAGAIVQGPTGVSKTRSLECITRQLPQVIEHGENEACGWLSLKQLVWLRVFMPDDANRRTLYLTIIREIDRLLGTNYIALFKERTKNGPMLLLLLHILSIHRCGLIIIEEIQERNVSSPVLGKEFVSTFLRLLNAGIPVVLVGNPLGMQKVLEFSQDLRRFSQGGIFDFYPAYAVDDKDWSQVLVPQIWSWTIFSEPDEIPAADLVGLLFQRTGAILDVLTTYRRECLISALRRSAKRVEQVDLSLAWGSAAMRPLHALGAAYADHNIDALMKWGDQPIAWLQRNWMAEESRRSMRKKAIEHHASTSH